MTELQTHTKAVGWIEEVPTPTKYKLITKGFNAIINHCFQRVQLVNSKYHRSVTINCIS